MAKVYELYFNANDQVRSQHRFDVKRGMAKREYTPEAQFEMSDQTAVRLMVGGALVGSGIAQEFATLSGHKAKANRIKTGTIIGTSALAGAKLGSKFGVGGAVAGAVIGAGISLGQMAYRFEKDITESNALATYLSEQTLTRTDNSRGNYYKWRA
jgi:hypothetical protein